MLLASNTSLVTPFTKLTFASSSAIRSTMVSLTGWPAALVMTKKRSAPSYPRTVSVPLPPANPSLPRWPYRKSLPDSPYRLSLPT